MNTVTCLFNALSDLPPSAAADRYRSMVIPLEYEFDVVVGSRYFVLGYLDKRSTRWLYLVPVAGDIEVRSVPMELVDQIQLSKFLAEADLCSARDGSEFVTASLAVVERWFARYIDDDPNVHAMVSDQVREWSCTCAFPRASWPGSGI